MTKHLKLRRRDDGYYVTQWVDGAGRRRTRTFGNVYDVAAERFAEFAAAWRAGGKDAGVTVHEAWRQFQAQQRGHYRRPDGSPTRTMASIEAALQGMLDRYGDRGIDTLAVADLTAMRNAWIEYGYARRTINTYFGWCVQFLRWAMGKGWVDDRIVARAAAQRSLSAGRSVLREDGVELTPEEREPCRHVDDAYVDAVIRHFEPRQPELADLVRLIDITGMRPGEALSMTAGQMQMSGPVWRYHPRRHKTARHQERWVFLGPQAQAILRRRLTTDMEALVFPGLDVRSLARAIAKVCAKLNIPHWSPKVLRHRAATRFRAQFGSEMARVMLGHSKVATTEIYGERDAIAAMRAAEQAG